MADLERRSFSKASGDQSKPLLKYRTMAVPVKANDTTEISTCSVIVDILRDNTSQTAITLPDLQGLLDGCHAEDKIWVNVSVSSAPTQLTLSQVMQALKSKFGLPPLAVKDSLQLTNSIKVDRYPDCLYSTVLVFSNKAPSINTSHKRWFQSRTNTRSGSGPIQARSGSGPIQGTSNINNGSLTDAADVELEIKNDGPAKLTTQHSLRQRLDLIQTKRGDITSTANSPLQLQFYRACFFLMERLLISVGEPVESVENLTTCFTHPADEEDMRGKRACFLYYRLLEALVLESRKVVNDFYDEVMKMEGTPFNKHSVWTLKKDELQTQQLHLITRELQNFRHHMMPIHRGLSTLSKSWEESVTPGGSQPLIDAETGDFLEEVLDEVVGIMDDIDVLTSSAQALTALMFGLTAYRATVSTQLLTGVSMVFLPLTWIVGIYGTNFSIFPELSWGIAKDEDDGQPDGWAGGYLYLWCIMLSAAFVSVFSMVRMNIF